MSKEKAIELGLAAYRSEGEARWMYGDALREYGWKPSEGKGHSTGGLDLIEAFRQDLSHAEGSNCDVAILPDPTTLERYAVAAAVPAKERKGLGIWVAYEAVVSTNADTALNLIQRIRSEKGTVTRDLVRQYTGKAATAQTVGIKPPSETPLAALPATQRVAAIREALEDEETQEALAEDEQSRVSIERSIEQTYPREMRNLPKLPRDLNWSLEGQLFQAYTKVYWAYVKTQDSALSPESLPGLARQAEQIEDWARALKETLRGESPAREILEDINQLLVEARNRV